MLDFAKRAFEGLVCPLLQGYLGRYIKDIHKEQLNISLWNGEVLLENVELILESFDYLQLPFALKQGRVGRLSIKIPWTKLGREPIVISLEDVFICVSTRDEQEWSLDAVEKRELAAKKAKLAAAELAKLSRRVSDDQAGRSFNSYITAKILDSIQVSISNFHVAYSDIQNDKAQMMFGLRFSSLTILKQNSHRSFSGKNKGGQVSKIVEILGIQVYFSRLSGAVDLLSSDKMWDLGLHTISRIEGNQWDHILAPFDVSASLLVNRSGNVDIDVNGEISDLVLSLDDVQLQQILIIWDYLSTYQLREKYGRYRPLSDTLSIKPPGWQKLWWHYAQESVLSDIRRKLKKTSWKYLGQRLSYRRKYVNLYKTKLDFLRLEQSIDESTLRELEQMERESDIDDILSFRSTAEYELQEFLSKSLIPNIGMSVANVSVEKSQSDERSSGRSRGWLNWLSRGMLGAGGTDDSNQFSGVVSDEVVKDIYEATKFHPPDIANGDSANSYKLYSSAFKFSIRQISGKLKRIKTGQEIAQLMLDGGSIDCKCWDDFATVNVFIKSWKMLNPCSNQDIIRKPSADVFLEHEEPAFKFQVDVSHKQKVEVSAKVNLQPIEVTWDSGFFLNMFEFISLLQSFELHDGRVLASMNGFKDVRARLLSKTEFVLSNRARVIWDVSIMTIILNIPWTNPVSDECKLVLKLGDCQLSSINNPDAHASNIGDQSYILKHASKISSSEIMPDFQLIDLYDLFELKLHDFEIGIVISQHPNMITMLKKCSSLFTLASCLISDESVLKQLEVGVRSSLLHLYLSPSVCVCLLQLIVELHAVFLRSESTIVQDQAPVPLLSINVNVDSFNLEVDFANDVENSTILKLAFGQLEICYYSAEFEECLVSMKSLKIVTFPCRNEMDSLLLCSSGDISAADVECKNESNFALCNQYKEPDRKKLLAQVCFYLHYQAQRNGGFICNKCAVYFGDADIHCYPFLIKLLVEFYEHVAGYGLTASSDNSNGPFGSKCKEAMPTFSFERFGFSNFLDMGSSENGSISLNSFPFIKVHNARSVGSLENSLIHPIHEWRKYFTLRKYEVRSPEGSIEKDSTTFVGQTLDPTTGLHEVCFSNGHCETNVVVLDLNLFGIKFHFHDSSGTVGTITLPMANSSLLICENFLDMVCSTEGLSLTSSWWTHNFKEYLWGPSSSDLPPILNVRVRKGHAGAISSPIEVSIGVQHACCVLPPEYLSIIIGYFSLPDWSYCSNKESARDFYSVDMASDTSVMYKVEIIDSVLYLPVESDDCRFLGLEIPELFLSFVLESTTDNPFSDIHPECLVTPRVVAKRNNCLNIFGRNLFLSMLKYKNGYSCTAFDQESKCGKTTLIDKLCADVWVRMPSESELSKERSYSCNSVMGKIQHCQLSADDCLAIDGFLNLVDVINQLSSVEKISKFYNSDVAHFHQWKECVLKQEVGETVVPDPTLTEVKLCVDSLSIKLHQSRTDINYPVPVATIDMQFVFSVSLRDETLIYFNVSFYSLAIYSLLSSVLLAQCHRTCSTLSVLVISLSQSIQGANELLLVLPSIDAWIYIYDWTEVINLFICCTEKLKASATINAARGSSPEEKACTAEKAVALPAESSVHSAGTSPYSLSKNMQQGSLNLIMRSENIGITSHFPVSPCQILERPKFDSTNSAGGNDGKVIEVTVDCSGEVSTDGLNTRLKVNLEKVSGSVGICENQSLSSWPFFQFSQVDFSAEICADETNLSCARVEVNCDRIDMWFSYHIFYFWHDLISAVPESGSPQFGLRELEFKFNIRKSSLLLTDGRWTCSGPLLEIILKNFIVHADATESSFKTSVASDLHVNYNNINKVLWESFVEPWSFQIKITSELEKTALLNSSIVTDVTLQSAAPLNLNFTESFFECVFRTMEMVKDACGLMGETDVENHEILSLQFTKNVYTRRYAPYVLQNLTSLPLAYHVYRGMDNAEDISATEMNDGNSVQPGSSVPIYLNETPEEQLFRYRPAHSSDRLGEKQSNEGSHHYITIQLDGTAEPSAPMSMDLVGRRYFEVDFSKVSHNIEAEREEHTSRYNIASEKIAMQTEESGFVVPVVFDVSVQRHSKLIRLYSTVILLNATSIPMELKFEIPFALSPKIIGPIYPNKEFPLPLHLAEVGWMKWRPLEKSVLWSEAFNVSNILSQESKTGFLRSIVCYPSMPRSDPFRCCISVKSIILPSSKKPKEVFHLSETSKKPVENYKRSVHELDNSRKQFVHQITFSTPLVVNNYLPEAILLRLETAGDTQNVLLSEIVTHFHHIDSTQDLGLEFRMDGYVPSFLKFPRAETFTTIAKFSGTRFSLTEIMTFNPVMHNGPLYIFVEKSMDAFSGVRELFVFVPFLLYNCTGFPLAISAAGNEMKGAGYIIPSCYELIEQELFQPKTDGLCFLTSDLDSNTASDINSPKYPLHDNRVISSRDNINVQLKTLLSKPYMSLVSSKPYCELLSGYSIQDQENSTSAIKDGSGLSIEVNKKDSCILDSEPGKFKPYMYSPKPTSSDSEIMVRVSRCWPEFTIRNIPISSWSVPFSLVMPSGSTNVSVPRSSPKAAYIICITSSPLGGPLAGRTQAITFQPRYVIANACTKDLCYKQKGTGQVYRLGVGKHSHLHYTDTTRDLLVSVRFFDPGWLWSGNFLPDHIGDTQVKMRNCDTGSVKMIRIEVQNADVSIRDEQIVGNLHGNSGTNLILLSDDDTGYMPYRIDNFSREKLRIYQQKCETFDTVIQPYTSSPYTWDEPCYPHRLTVEVPGERVLGSYSLDDTKQYAPAYLASTSEKPERTLLISVHAEGATKVLSIIDSNYHISKDMMGSNASRSIGRGCEQKRDKLSDYTEKLSFKISDIGISLVDSYQQELLFFSAKSVRLDLLQSLDQQKLCFQISTFQVDNQLRTTPYPVILSFDCEHGNHSASLVKYKDDAKKPISERILQTFSDSSYEPVFNLAVAKWRKKDISLVSFEYINLRVADFHLELEQEVVLSLFDMYRTVYSRFQSSYLPFSDPTFSPFINDMALQERSIIHIQTNENISKSQFQPIDEFTSDKSNRTCPVLPLVVPIGAPWQQIYLLARRQKKVYVQSLDITPINLTVSFSSTPWMLRNGVLTSGESVIHRGLMALADVEGARIHLNQLSITHHMASMESIQELLIRHYTRQLLHEIYKVFGSAGVIGNPMGFARSVGLGIKDFLSVPARSALQSPTGLFTGMAQGTTSLLSNTVYAISDAATQFTKAAHKGIVAFTFDDQAKEVAPCSRGVINEVLEGLTGLLQSPIRGAEKHGLPGILSGVAMGITGLVARPAASILEVTGKTAQSIRNRSRLSHMGHHRYRVRLPRPLSRELPLRPYSWEEAVGISVLTEADDELKFKDEVLVTCKALKQPGKFVIITERLILVSSSSSLKNFGKPEFRGVPVDLEWVIESEVGLESVIHADAVEGTVHIVGSSSDVIQKHHQSKKGTLRTKHWSNPPTPLPLFQTNLEFTSNEDAENLLRILLSMIEHGKEQGWGTRHILHQSNMK